MEEFKDFDDMIEKTAENIRNSDTGIFALMALMALNPELEERIREKAYDK